MALLRLQLLSVCQRYLSECQHTNTAKLFKSIHRCYTTNVENLRKTCLHDFHVKHGGKMVDFAGWSMPVQYSDQGVIASHLHTRSHASVFDVSHMLQTRIFGKDRNSFMESLLTADIDSLKDNGATLSLFTNDKGGIRDDLILAKPTEDYLYLVSNAGCADKDLAYMMAKAEEFRGAGNDVAVETYDYGLLAVQGPATARLLQPHLSCDLSKLTFMTSTLATLYGVDGCRVTRCGYTGEDGVEISIPQDRTEYVAEQLLSVDEVKLAGLGARDSLRLEAGLCLYGSDIDENTTPLEASLKFTIAKKRRTTGGFPGADIILNELQQKPVRKRVGLLSTGPPARGGTHVYNEQGTEKIGTITSGCPSPSLKKNIAMAYIDRSLSKLGSTVKLEVRNKMHDAQVMKMPFVPIKYYYGV